MNFAFSFQQQFKVLLEETHTTNMRALARSLDVGQQTVLSLLHGMSASPRLDLAFKLCQHFGVSLDYFDLDDEDACRHYLSRLRGAVLDSIGSQSAELPTDTQTDVLAMMEWLRRVQLRSE